MAVGSCEISAIGATTESTPVRLGQREQVGVVEQDLAAENVDGGRQQSHDRACGHRLARTRFADDRDGLASSHGEGDVVQQDRASSNPNGEMLDGEERVVRLRRRLGRRPIPNRSHPPTRAARAGAGAPGRRFAWPRTTLSRRVSDCIAEQSRTRAP